MKKKILAPASINDVQAYEQFSRKPYIGLQSKLVQNCEDYNASFLSGCVCTEYGICYCRKLFVLMSEQVEKEE